MYNPQVRSGNYFLCLIVDGSSKIGSYLYGWSEFLIEPHGWEVNSLFAVIWISWMQTFLHMQKGNHPGDDDDDVSTHMLTS